MDQVDVYDESIEFGRFMADWSELSIFVDTIAFLR